MSITDILSLTLAFVHDEKTWEQQEDQKSEEQAEKRARTSLYPSPRYKSEKELETLEQCLTRWTEELLQDMEGEQGPWSLKYVHTYKILQFKLPEMSL